MIMERFIKKCEEFVICGSYGDANVTFADGFPENNAIYHIITKGTVKMGVPFESDYITLDYKNNNFVDVKDYLYKNRIYMSLSSYYMYGFNSIDIKQDWNGKLVEESFEGDNKSWLICFNGTPIINGVTLQSMDYAKLESKHYNVDINDAIVGIFTKL